jgi:hypothetical protein
MLHSKTLRHITRISTVLGAGPSIPAVDESEEQMNQCDLPIGENCPFFCGQTYVYIDNEHTKPICDNALICQRAIAETKNDELIQVLRELERQRMEQKEKEKRLTLSWTKAHTCQRAPTI